MDWTLGPCYIDNWSWRWPRGGREARAVVSREIDPEKLSDLFSPGKQVDVLLGHRESQQERSVRRAMILGQQEGDLAMSPPEPPLPEPVLGRPMEVTIVAEGQGEPGRYGFQTMVLDMVADYPGEQGGGQAVVVMFPRPEDVYPTSLRQAKRYKVPTGGFLSASRADAPGLELLDISAKGLRLFWPGVLPGDLGPESEVRLALNIHDEQYQVVGRVAGISPRQDGQEISLDLGVLPLDLWTSLLVSLHELEHGPGEGKTAS